MTVGRAVRLAGGLVLFNLGRRNMLTKSINSRMHNSLAASSAVCIKWREGEPASTAARMHLRSQNCQLLGVGLMLMVLKERGVGLVTTVSSYV